MVLNTKSIIEAADLSLSPTSESPRDQSTVQEFAEVSLSDLERTHIHHVLQHTQGNKSRAASILGIERSTLDRKLKRYQSED